MARQSSGSTTRLRPKLASPPAATPFPKPAVFAPPAEGSTKREANKLDKLRRIQTAAHELFVEKGYDNATMRDIAAHAKVALGTLFLYASNKRDLLFLIANDIMISAVEEAAGLVDVSAPLTDNLVLIAGVHLRVFGDKPELFRLVLRELLFYDSGNQAIRAAENRRRLLTLYQDVVAGAASAGEIRPEVDAELAGQVFFAIVQAEVRRWIALEQRVLASGLAASWAAISLVVGGLKECSQTPKPSPAVMRKLLTQLERQRATPAPGKVSRVRRS